MINTGKADKINKSPKTHHNTRAMYGRLLSQINVYKCVKGNNMTPKKKKRKKNRK